MGSLVIKAVAEFVRSESAPTAVEYAVMLALILLVVFAAVAAVGEGALALFQSLMY